MSEFVTGEAVSSLPLPPVPSDCDVSKLNGFMLDTVRLLGSELWALSTGDEFKAAVALWCRAWHQVPAASLPDDDRILCSFTGFGRDVKAWKQVRAMALHGFVLCSDGRLYHPVLADDANRAVVKVRERHDRTKAATEARQAKRHEQRQVNVTKSHRQDRTIIPQTPFADDSLAWKNRLAKGPNGL